MVFVDFEDAPGAGFATQDIRGALVKKARRWLAQASYGRARLRASAHHQWVRMPQPSTAYWPPGGVYRPEQYIRDAIRAADPAVDFAGSEIVYIVAAPGSQVILSPAYAEHSVRADRTTLGRFATLGQDIYSAPAGSGAARMIQATLRLFSMPYLDDPGQAGAPGNRWAGAWDPMGEAGLLAHPSAWTKRKLGWLRPGRSLLCIKRGEVTKKLSAISRSRGLRAVSVRLSKKRRYVVEARRRRGIDSEICAQGVLVWLVDGRRGSGAGPMRVEPARTDSDDPGRPCRRHGITGALDRAPLGPGQRFRDRDRGVVVEVLGRTRQGYRVRVGRR